MKLSPEDTATLAKQFTDEVAEGLADKIGFHLNREVSDETYGELRDGLQDAVTGLLGKVEIT